MIDPVCVTAPDRRLPMLYRVLNTTMPNEVKIPAVQTDKLVNTSSKNQYTPSTLNTPEKSTIPNV